MLCPKSPGGLHYNCTTVQNVKHMDNPPTRENTFIAKERGIMCKLTKEEEYSIISRTMTNIRSLRTYVRELDFEQLLDMQEKLNTVIEDAVKMLNEKRLNVRNWKLNVNRYLSTSFLWGLTRKNGRVQFLLLQGQRKPNENPKAV